MSFVSWCFPFVLSVVLAPLVSEVGWSEWIENCEIEGTVWGWSGCLIAQLHQRAPGGPSWWVTQLHQRAPGGPSWWVTQLHQRAPGGPSWQVTQLHQRRQVVPAGRVTQLHQRAPGGPSWAGHSSPPECARWSELAGHSSPPEGASRSQLAGVTQLHQRAPGDHPPPGDRGTNSMRVLHGTSP